MFLDIEHSFNGEETTIITSRALRNCVIGAVLLLAVAVASRTITVKASTPGRLLSHSEDETVADADQLMRSKKLTSYASFAAQLGKQGKWRAALTNDEYLATAEKAGDTPYAYTLPDDNSPHHPIAIVLAPRFFDSATTSTARAALMIHEMGHWKAFVANGNSTEFDGYKAEFDTHKQLGLTAKDSLTYFMMLDGVDQYVVPIIKSYAEDPEVKAYKAGN